MGERKLAHAERVIDIRPIPGADRVELATVLGWHCMVKKGQFHVGDLGIYIEIDSKCPPTEQFAFLESKHYSVKTQKYFKGTVISQGLLMTPQDLGLYASDLEEGQDLTEKLGITYYEPEDNQRKAPSVDKYKKMANRYPNLFKRAPVRWLMKRTWGKKLLFKFFGRKSDKKNGWPEWVVKTDENRIQNVPWLLEDKEPYTVTEKIDGTSATYSLHRGKRGKNEFYVCSRNVVQQDERQETYYQSNVYWQIAKKYNLESVLTELLKRFPSSEWVTLQGEIYGYGIQKRTYGLKDHRFAAFNLITSEHGRYPSGTMKTILDEFEIPSVPILEKGFILPGTVDEMVALADGVSEVDGEMREGLVLRSADGQKSFKVVSNEYLIRYH